MRQSAPHWGRADQASAAHQIAQPVPDCGCGTQVIAGVLEERGIEVLFAGNPRAQNLLSFVARTGNTFLGSLMWVDYVRLLGLQGGAKH